jgi:hypothetical protein
MRSFLGYSVAGLAIVAMLVMPFVLLPLFTRAVAATGVHVDPVYSGGSVVRAVERPGYRIEIGGAVRSAAPLSRITPFVQLTWTPADSLPAHVADEVDLDGDGRADARVTFEVPRDPAAPLFVDVVPLGPGVKPLAHASRESFSGLIARVDRRIVVRVPLAR